jgi:hypothetical protein
LWCHCLDSPERSRKVASFVFSSFRITYFNLGFPPWFVVGDGWRSYLYFVKRTFQERHSSAWKNSKRLFFRTMPWWIPTTIYWSTYLNVSYFTSEKLSLWYTNLQKNIIM